MKEAYTEPSHTVDTQIIILAELRGHFMTKEYTKELKRLAASLQSRFDDKKLLGAISLLKFSERSDRVTYPEIAQKTLSLR